MRRSSLVFGLAVLAAACSHQPPPHGAAHASPRPAAVDASRLVAADQDTADWMTYGRTYDQQRFSPLEQLDAANVARLSLAWHYDLPTAGHPIPGRAEESTPLVIDGVLYVSGSWGTVFALDARSGTLLWSFDPKVPRSSGGSPCCRAANRGVAAWKGKLYLGTLDGRLVALDAATGKPVWAVRATPAGSGGRVTGAPLVIKGRVLLGESAARAGSRGNVSAYDAATGALDWRYYAAGGGVCGTLAYDPKLDLLYVGTGSAAAASGGAAASSGVLALRPETGQYVWYRQTARGASAALASARPMILADLVVDGKPRHTIVQASANDVEVVDRVTGKLISARPLAAHPRRAPAHEGETPSSSWEPMSFSPLTRLVYVPVSARVAGQLDAWDPVAQKQIWSAMAADPSSGGVLSTAGNLVFEGSGSGELDAYRATDGVRLWSAEVGTGILAPPITYEVGGTQYVVVEAGWNGTRGPAAVPRLLAFSLTGKDALLRPAPPPQSAPPAPPAQAPNAGGTSRAPGAAPSSQATHPPPMPDTPERTRGPLD